MTNLKPWQFLFVTSIMFLCTGAGVLAIAGLIHSAR